MVGACRFAHLGRNPNSLRICKRCFEDVAAPFAAETADVDRLTLVCEHSIARDDPDGLDARQAGNDVFGQPIAEDIEFPLLGNYIKWQDGDRRFIFCRHLLGDFPLVAVEISLGGSSVVWTFGEGVGLPPGATSNQPSTFPGNSLLSQRHAFLPLRVGLYQLSVALSRTGRAHQSFAMSHVQRRS